MGNPHLSMATVLPSWHAAAQNRKLTIMSVGNNKAEKRAPRRVHFSDHYEQTVLVGHFL